MTYKDISLMDMGNLYDNTAIKQAVKNIVFTEVGELLGMPEFGARTRSMLFEQMSVSSISTMRTILETSLYRYEPRITFITVDIVAQKADYAVNCTISYTIKETDTKDIISLKLS